MKIIIHLALAFFLFTLLSQCTISTANSASATKAAISFVKTTCNSTTYPSLCNKICLPNAPKIKGDLRRMAIYALKGAIHASKKAAVTISNLSKDTKLKKSERMAIKDCVEENKYALSELKGSLTQIGAMKNMSSYKDVKFKIYSIKTWLSAVLTNEDSCTNGLDEENVDTRVKAKIANAIRYVSMLCSNSLSIVDLMQY